MVDLNSPYAFEKKRMEPIIYRYHSQNRPFLYFVKKDSTITTMQQAELASNGEESVPYLGVELEFDTRDKQIGSVTNKKRLIARSNEIFGNGTFVYYMNDGSLLRGLEMITQPATYEVHELISDKYQRLFEEIKSHGFKSDSYSTCGLHIHFNRNFFEDNPDLYTMNLLYLMERFWKEFVLMSRRNYDKIVQWANKYYKKPKDVLDDMKLCGYVHGNRYHAVNLTNTSTIEFRIYRGTLNFDYFMAILELTQNLIIAAKTKTPEQLQSMDFMSLITSDRLMKYYRVCHRKSNMKKCPAFLG